MRRFKMNIIAFATATLIITSIAEAHGRIAFKNPIDNSGSKGSKPLLRLIAGYSDDSLSFDPLCVYFDVNATYFFDGEYDALKLYNTDKNVTNFFSFANDGSMLAINGLPQNDTSSCNVCLGLKTDRDGDVIFMIQDLEGEFNFKNIFITDMVTGISIDLIHTKQYTINLQAGEYHDRFLLKLSNLISDVPDLNPDNDWFNIYASHGILKAEIKPKSWESGTLVIYNLLGHALKTYKIYSSGYHEFYPDFKDGIYLTTYNYGNKRISKKIYYRK
jgi:hypothetical protein